MSFLQKLKDGLIAHFDAPYYSMPKLKIIKSKKSMVHELLHCLEKQKAVGVYCPALADGLLLTGIEDMMPLGKDALIIFKPFDMNGIPLKRSQVKLSEIKSICPFDSCYEMPMKNVNEMQVLHSM